VLVGSTKMNEEKVKVVVYNDPLQFNIDHKTEPVSQLSTKASTIT